MQIGSKKKNKRRQKWRKKMRAENFEIQTKSLTDELPVCHSTGTGTATNQIYKEDGTRQEIHKSYDHSFQCQQIDDST